MEDQIVSFETAKLAKEKGFDEFLPTYYTHVKADPSVQIDDKWFRNSQFPETSYRLCSAPTQSLLQRWLRDKYKLHVFVMPYDDKELQQLLFENKLVDKDFNEFSSFNFTHTYEECLEEALQLSLNELLK